MRTYSFLFGLATGATLIGFRAAPPKAPAKANDPEVTRLCAEDQADREAKSIDWPKVSVRDAARRKRIFEIYRSGGLKTGSDWENAALVLQHGEGDDQLLAHEMCVAALSLGDHEAKWLAAASEDRWLDHIGRKQRFGTQYKGDQSADGKMLWHLVPIEEPGVSDAHRVLMIAHTKAEVLAQVARMNQP